MCMGGDEAPLIKCYDNRHTDRFGKISTVKMQD